MTPFEKAIFILKTQGIRALARRGFAKMIAQVRAASDRRQLRGGWKKSVRLAAQKRSLIFPPSPPSPQVSIIIPMHGNDVFTYNCLRSILEHWDSEISVETIIVDDASPAATQTWLQSIQGVRCVRNAERVGFVESCNRGADLASGDLLLFLNNDTIVQAGWLAALVQRKHSDPKIAAVGSRLLYPDGTIAEAGAIIWRDGSGWNYGRGCDRDDPAYNYFREVDYCSAASLLVDRKQFLDFGRFDERYSPGYYEDADFSFTLRSHGFKTVFEPKSVVVHFEGVTGGIDERGGAKKFQALNRSLFERKWARELEGHCAPDPAQARLAARRLSGQPKVAFIDAFIPFEDRDAGSLRLSRVLALAREVGCDVTFYPHDGVAHEPYAGKLRDRGIEILCGTRRKSARSLLVERMPIFDLAWICRPELAATYTPLIRSHGTARVYYDTVDLHFIRLEREEQIAGKKTGWQHMRQLEIGLAKAADGTIVSSPVEKDVLEREGVSNIHVIPPMCSPVQRRVPREQRAGILFLGNYVHSPNVDAAIFLAKEVFPLIAREIANVQLTLIGNEPPPSVRALQTDKIHVVGYVEQIEPFLERARVFIAPMR
ncbi:MAG: glycosyltransferase, partial [Candidatus Eremiobacteraeota bacterium]|nr:glycosyltransferase [Candidatus Eremiobacteraeota bacterium]